MTWLEKCKAQPFSTQATHMKRSLTGPGIRSLNSQTNQEFDLGQVQQSLESHLGSQTDVIRILRPFAAKAL